MEDNLYTIILSDGYRIDNLRKRGTCFVSEEELDLGIFEGNLSTVLITDGEVTNSYKDLKISTDVGKLGEGFWFTLINRPKEEIKMDKIQSNIDYIAMMSNIDI